MKPHEIKYCRTEVSRTGRREQSFWRPMTIRNGCVSLTICRFTGQTGSRIRSKTNKNTGFRFYRLKDLTAGVLNKDDYTEDQPFTIADLHIFGERYETVTKLKDIALKVENAVPVQDTLVVAPRAVTGDKVILIFKETEPVSDIEATIQGESVAVIPNGDGSYTAEYTVHEGTKSGYVAIKLNYTYDGGKAADPIYFYPETFVTDPATNTVVAQKILISNTSNEITEQVKPLIKGSHNTLDATEAAYLFDGKVSTSADVRYSNGGWGYYDIDFGDGQLMKLDRIEILGRPGFPGRVGAVSVSALAGRVNVERDFRVFEGL